MSLRGYIKKGKPALWVTMRCGKSVAEVRPGKSPRRSNNVRRETPKRAAEQRQYLKRSREWLVGKYCIVTRLLHEQDPRVFVLPANQVHHIFGRRGRLLNWEPGWAEVSDFGQRWIHNHPAEAMKLGLIGPTGTWNDYERAVAHERKLHGKIPTSE